MVFLTVHNDRQPLGPDGSRHYRSVARVLIFIVLVAAGSIAFAEEPVVDEYKVKAAFAFSFAKFVEWPHNAGYDGSLAFRLGILGVDPFGDAINEVVGGKTVRGAPVEILRSRRLSDLEDCDVLFIADSEAPRLHQHLAELSGLPVLTISDVPDFVRSGGMIGLCREGSRVCFEVNRSALGNAGLAVSSRLLVLARDVVGAGSQASGATGEGSW